jgi:hypothetical protein
MELDAAKAIHRHEKEAELFGLTDLQLLSNDVAFFLKNDLKMLHASRLVDLVCFLQKRGSSVVFTTIASEVANFVYLRRKPNDEWQ